MVKEQPGFEEGGVVFKHCVFAKRLALSSPVCGGRTGRDDGSVWVSGGGGRRE